MFEANRINIVVAHPAEAKPLCAMLHLRAFAVPSPFRIFSNDAGVSLIVSGMGKVAAASATAYLAGLQARLPVSAWLNIGIAGHRTAAIGTGLLAHKITDAANCNTFFPPQLVQSYPTSEVISVDTPEQGYPKDAAYDMEAAGFYASASSMATAELVHVFKVISDNQQQSLAAFNISQVDGLISVHRYRLQELLQDLDALLDIYRSAYALPDEYAALLGKYRFTASQRSQLKRLCERFRALELEGDLKKINKEGFASAKQLLSALQMHITQQAQY